MRLVVHPGNPLRGTVRLPGDKSLSHRAVLLAAMADGDSRIENFLVSGVTQAMLHGLEALDIPYSLEGTSLRVSGRPPASWRTPTHPLDCGNSATTIRLLAGALAASGVEAVLDGSTGLRARPMGRIVEPLRAMGATIEAAEGEKAPLTLRARPREKKLTGIDWVLPVASAQVKSCLLLAGLAAYGPTTLIEPGPSRDHTERMLRNLGIRIEQTILERTGKTPDYRTRFFPPEHLSLPPINLTLPGDFSSGAFLITAALIAPGSEVTLEGVGINPTRTGLLDAFRAMGADLEVRQAGEAGGEPVGCITARYSCLNGAQISGPLVVRMIDEFPAFATAAAFARGESLVRDAAELRTKESDRIEAICNELSRMGSGTEAAPDGFTIRGTGSPLQGARVYPHGDHRLAMSLAAAGLGARGATVIEGAEILAESFPDFVQVIRELGGEIELDG
ncbi:MAG TPA: 3-phosphoshikimate 1-carboxyvinyltransferase [Anaerolineaceae bacterium]|nr:3-phosphoshikimate 1-carboxyvinyltransferase [Anaerolineaceae bacterium]